MLACLLGATVGVSGSSFFEFDFDSYNLSDETIGLIGIDVYRFFMIAAFIALGIFLYSLFLGSYTTVGLTGMGCQVLDGEKPRVGMLFPRGIYWKAVGMNFLRGLFVSLWSLLFVIPGILAAYSYSMADYLLYTHPEMGVMEVLRESKRRMYGHRMGLFCLSLSFFGWMLLASLPALSATVAAESKLFWVILGIGSLVSAIANLFVMTYMHIATVAYFRNADRAGVWRDQAQQGTAEFENARVDEEETANAADATSWEVNNCADESAARVLFMEYGCSRDRLREEGMLEEYEKMNVDSSMEQRWVREYAQSLMLRFDRDALILDALLMLAGEYGMDDLVSRILERIERHIRQETLPDVEILNMAGRVSALLVSGAFVDKEGFVCRKQQQISDMADRLEHRLEQTGKDGWQEAMRLIRSMCKH